MKWRYRVGFSALAAFKIKGRWADKSSWQHPSAENGYYRHWFP